MELTKCAIDNLVKLSKFNKNNYIVITNLKNINIKNKSDKKDYDNKTDI